MSSISTNEYKTAAENLIICISDYNDVELNFEIDIATSDINVLPEDTISDIKKKIKHCKNYMERKLLEQKLNSLYKNIKNGGIK